MSRTLDRRRFLALTAATLPALRSFAQPAAHALTLHPDRPGPAVPSNFIGLSYETQQLADPTFFSADNSGLIAQFKALTPSGVLRLGGNTSDLGWWRPTPGTPQPVIHVRDSHGAEPTAAAAFPVTSEAVRNLRAFLDATGWTCLYGINLGTNTPARAADEAAFVHATLGPKLEYFQLGNEPDGYSTHLRDPATWSANAFFDDWLAEANAIRARVPAARFGMPDVGWLYDWTTIVADRLAALRPSASEFCELHGVTGCADRPGDLTTRPRIAALSHHYYIGGPPSNPEMTIAHILQPDPKVQRAAALIRAAAAKLDAGPQPVPYRMTEGNTCYRGGKPGVSDVFASALWAADYLLTLASLGYAGVNLHGGTGKFVANSLGGHLPGDDLVHDAALHPHPYYTPIASFDAGYVAEPVLFGMAFAQRFAGCTLVPVDFHPGTANATAYAARRPSGQLIVAVINKDATQPVPINLRGFSVAYELAAPALDARSAQLAPPNANREASSVAPASAVLLESVRA